MIDTLLANVDQARRLAAWRHYDLEHGSYMLVTLHRPALVDSPELIGRPLASLERIAQAFPVIFPMHPRTRERIENLGLAPTDLIITEPLCYSEFLSLEAGAGCVVTDSGGVQEETTALGVPCFTLRDTTERPVTITHGTNFLLGLDPMQLEMIPELLESAVRPAEPPPLWDGAAGERAATEIERLLEVGLSIAA